MSRCLKSLDGLCDAGQKLLPRSWIFDAGVPEVYDVLATVGATDGG